MYRHINKGDARELENNIPYTPTEDNPTTAKHYALHHTIVTYLGIFVLSSKISAMFTDFFVQAMSSKWG